jgi:hypothetical protein
LRWRPELHSRHLDDARERYRILERDAHPRLIERALQPLERQRDAGDAASAAKLSATSAVCCLIESSEELALSMADSDSLVEALN